MAETTGIEWTDPLIKPLASLKFSLVPNAIRFEMPPFMALMAEGYAVANLKPEAGEFRERLNMMRSQIAATAVSAVLASIVIALKNRLSPIAVFGASAGLAIPLSQTMLVVVMLFASRIGRTSNKGNLQFCFLSMLYAQPRPRLSFKRLAQLLSGFGAMLFTLERGNATPQRSVGIVRGTTVFANCGSAICTAVIYMEFEKRFPLTTLATMLLATVNALYVFFERKPQTLSGTFYCPRFITAHLVTL